MSVFLMLTIMLLWYSIGYFCFILSIVILYGYVDDEDINMAFFFAIVGPVVLFVGIIAYIIKKTDSKNIANKINNIVDKFKK